MKKFLIIFATVCYILLGTTFFCVWKIDHDPIQLNILKSFAYQVHELLYPNSGELLDLALNSKSIGKFLDSFSSIMILSPGTPSDLNIHDEDEFLMYYYQLIGENLEKNGEVQNYLKAWINQNASRQLYHFVDIESENYYSTLSKYYSILDLSAQDYYTGKYRIFYQDVQAYYLVLACITLFGTCWLIIVGSNVFDSNNTYNPKEHTIMLKLLRFQAQFVLTTGILKKYVKDATNRTNNIDESGLNMVLWSNMYITYHHLIAWIFDEEKIDIRLCINEEIQKLAEERDYFNCEDLKSLINLSFDMKQGEEFYNGYVKVGILNFDFAEKQLDLINRIYNYFKALYRR